MNDNQKDRLVAIYHDRRDEVLGDESSKQLKVARFAMLERLDRLQGLTAEQQGIIDSLTADFLWLESLQAVRDQALVDIENAADAAAAQAVIDSVVWPVR